MWEFKGSLKYLAQDKGLFWQHFVEAEFVAIMYVNILDIVLRPSFF
jgi:hypothetical protein